MYLAWALRYLFSYIFCSFEKLRNWKGCSVIFTLRGFCFCFMDRDSGMGKSVSEVSFVVVVYFGFTNFKRNILSASHA